MAAVGRGGAPKVAFLHVKDGARPAPIRRPSPHQNHLIDALPISDYTRLQTHFELVPMALGEVLYEPGARLRHVYFPTTSIVSLLYVMEDGARSEERRVGKVGRDRS